MARFLFLAFAIACLVIAAPVILVELARGHVLNAGFTLLVVGLLLSAANPDE